MARELPQLGDDDDDLFVIVMMMVSSDSDRKRKTSLSSNWYYHDANDDEDGGGGGVIVGLVGIKWPPLARKGPSFFSSHSQSLNRFEQSLHSIRPRLNSRTQLGMFCKQRILSSSNPPI